MLSKFIKYVKHKINNTTNEKTMNRMSVEYAIDLENQIDFLKMTIEHNIKALNENTIKNPVHPAYHYYKFEVEKHQAYSKEIKKEISKLTLQLRALNNYLELPND